MASVHPFAAVRSRPWAHKYPAALRAASSMLKGSVSPSPFPSRPASSQVEDEGRGWVHINGGTLNVSAGDDGVNASGGASTFTSAQGGMDGGMGAVKPWATTR